MFTLGFLYSLILVFIACCNSGEEVHNVVDNEAKSPRSVSVRSSIGEQVDPLSISDKIEDGYSPLAPKVDIQYCSSSYQREDVAS